MLLIFFRVLLINLCTVQSLTCKSFQTPGTQPPTLHQPLQAQTSQQPSTQAGLPLSGEASLREQTSGPQTQVPAVKKMETQPVMQTSASILISNPQSQPMPLHLQQTVQQPKGPPNIQISPSRIPNSTSLPTSSPSQPPLVQPQLPTASNQFQQPLPTPTDPHMPLQPPLPPRPRLPLQPAFQHQHLSQMSSNMSLQQSSSQLHHSQPVFHVSCMV